MPGQEVITEAERAERQRRVEDAIHNNEMEGLRVNADTLADADEYVAGRIDPDELIERASAFAAGELHANDNLRDLDREHFIDRLGCCQLRGHRAARFPVSAVQVVQDAQRRQDVA